VLLFRQPKGKVKSLPLTECTGDTEKGNFWSVSLIQSKFKSRSLAEFSEAQRKSKTYLVSYAEKGKG